MTIGDVASRWLRDWLNGPVDPTPYRDDADVARLQGGDTSVPFYEPMPSSQRRLAELEQVLAEFARSEGRAPSGSVRQQVEELIDRLRDYQQNP